MSISVGIPKPYSLRAPASKVCWAAGFPLMVDYTSDNSFARRLDRGRRIVLQKLLRELRRNAKAAEIRPTKRDIAEWNVRYDGFEFSYFRALFGPRRRPVNH